MDSQDHGADFYNSQEWKLVPWPKKTPRINFLNHIPCRSICFNFMNKKHTCPVCKKEAPNYFSFIIQLTDEPI